MSSISTTLQAALEAADEAGASLNVAERDGARVLCHQILARLGGHEEDARRTEIKLESSSKRAWSAIHLDQLERDRANEGHWKHAGSSTLSRNVGWNHLKGFVAAWIVFQVWILIGAGLFYATENPAGQEDLDNKAEVHAKYLAVLNTTCADIDDDDIDTLREWFSYYEQVGTGWRQNAWSFYDCYLFCFTYASFNGMWERDLQTDNGKMVLALFWAWPALIIGIMASTIMARVCYLATWNYLRFWTCGHSIDRVQTKCLRNFFGGCMRWRDRRAFALKYTLMALCIFGIFVVILDYLQQYSISHGHDVEGNGRPWLIVYLAFNLMTTIGIGDYSIDKVFGAGDPACIVFVQIVLILGLICIGTLFRLIDTMSEFAAWAVGLDTKSGFIGAVDLESAADKQLGPQRTRLERYTPRLRKIKARSGQAEHSQLPRLSERPRRGSEHSLGARLRRKMKMALRMRREKSTTISPD